MDDLQVRSAATDIFSYLVEFSPSMVREFVMQEAQQSDDVSHSGLQFVESLGKEETNKTAKQTSRNTGKSRFNVQTSLSMFVLYEFAVLEICSTRVVGVEGCACQNFCIQMQLSILQFHLKLSSKNYRDYGSDFPLLKLCLTVGWCVCLGFFCRTSSSSTWSLSR